MHVSKYKVIEDHSHTKSVPIYVSLSFWEKLLPHNWGKKNKLVYMKTPDPEFIVDHIHKRIICHPQHMTRLKFYLQKTGDRDDNPWLYRSK